MSYAYHMLSNLEKEKLVIDLYYNERKNVRQIAQEARMSFRDIAAILKKNEASAVNDGNGNGNGIVAAAEVNDDGSRSGNGIGVAVDNQQQQRITYSVSNLVHMFISFKTTPYKVRKILVYSFYIVSY
jgi:hypothetical protein